MAATVGMCSPMTHRKTLVRRPSAVLGLLPLSKRRTTGHAVDLGCGGGQVSILLARRGFNVVGVDYAETAVELAHRNAAKAEVAGVFKVADCTDLGFLGGESFDLVVDNHVSHCLIEPAHRESFFRNARRLVKPSGIFFRDNVRVRAL